MHDHQSLVPSWDEQSHSPWVKAVEVRFRRVKAVVAHVRRVMVVVVLIPRAMVAVVVEIPWVMRVVEAQRPRVVGVILEHVGTKVRHVDLHAYPRA